MAFFVLLHMLMFDPFDITKFLVFTILFSLHVVYVFTLPQVGPGRGVNYCDKCVCIYAVFQKRETPNSWKLKQ